MMGLEISSLRSITLLYMIFKFTDTEETVTHRRFWPRGAWGPKLDQSIPPASPVLLGYQSDRPALDSGLSGLRPVEVPHEPVQR